MDPHAGSPPPSRWWLAAILVVAAAARVWHLGTWDAWTDELHTIAIARTGEYSFGPAYRASPLNFVLTDWVLRLSGGGLVAARSLQVTVGLLTVLGLYLAGRRWFNERVGLFAAGVVALSMWHVYWSQVARHFALETLAVLGAIQGCFLVWRERRWWGALLTGAMFLLGLLTHSSAGFFLAGVGVFVALHWLLAIRRGGPVWPRGADRRHLALALGLAGALLLYLPAYVTVGKFLLNNIPPWNPPANVLGSFAFYLPAWLMIPAIGGGIVLVQDGDDMGAMLLTLIAVPVFLTTVAAAFTTASAAYGLAAILPVALLAGVGLDRLLADQGTVGQGTVRRAAAAVTLFALLTDLALYHSYYHGLKPRWKEAVALVASRRAPGDLIVATEADVVEYYLKERGVLWTDKVPMALDRAPSCTPPVNRGVWYIVYLTPGSPAVMPAALVEHLARSTQLIEVFPVAYGPKLRTVGVYYEAPPRCDP